MCSDFFKKIKKIKKINDKFIDSLKEPWLICRFWWYQRLSSEKSMTSSCVISETLPQYQLITDWTDGEY